MPLKNLPLSLEDFRRLSVDEILLRAETRDCDHYSSLFLKEADNAKAQGDEFSEEAFRLLSAVTSMMLSPHDAAKPFKPLFVFSDRRGAIPSDFSEQHLSALAEFAPEIGDDELRARVADVVWLILRRYKLALLAIKAYVRAADTLGVDRWPPLVHRLERALRLATSLGPKSARIRPLTSHVSGLLSHWSPESGDYRGANLIDLLLEFCEDLPPECADFSARAASFAEDAGAWRMARIYWELNAKSKTRVGDGGEAEAALVRAAETYVREAESERSESPGSSLATAVHLQGAISAYRKIGGHRERVAELHRRLLDIQEGVLAEMKRVSTTIDMSEEIRAAEKHVTRESFRESIFALCLVASPPEFESLRRDVDELIKEHPIQFLVSSSMVDELGRVLCQMPDVMSDDPKTQDAGYRIQMIQRAELHHSITAQGLIHPARRKIVRMHRPDMNAILEIVKESPLVPPGREMLWAQGLWAGLIGEMVNSIHILVPQFEHSLRVLLNGMGVITSTIESDGTQEERGLNYTLYLPETRELFGVDTVFSLQGFLVEKAGQNLRNRMAHGLMGYEGFFSSLVNYLWWLLLRICCLPVINATIVAGHEEGEKEENASDVNGA